MFDDLDDEDATNYKLIIVFTMLAIMSAVQFIICGVISDKFDDDMAVKNSDRLCLIQYALSK